MVYSGDVSNTLEKNILLLDSVPLLSIGRDCGSSHIYPYCGFPVSLFYQLLIEEC